MNGLVYNTWRGTSYVKAACGPCQPRSSRQLAIRALSTRFVRGFQALGQAAIDAWNVYASAHPEIDWTGNSRRITGSNWFTRLNVRLVDMGQAPITDPPAVPAPDPLLGLTVAGITDGITVTWATDGTSDKQVDLWLAGPYTEAVAAKLPGAKHNLYQGIESNLITCDALQKGFYTAFARVIDEATGLDSTWQSGKAEAK